ncbi:MAG: hypothetical protein O2958_14655 [Gemmatimonadetes bacterium]|nr:hypothetical protein [Gemmatimonadota bacterium]MDA1104645.1 hypothetical protein [Gemmatimonadota bacterium]
MRSSVPVFLTLNLCLGGLLAPSSARAQALEGCDKIEGLVAAGSYVEALEELNWCERGITDLHFKRILEILETPILGYQPGEGTAEAVMGFSTIEITHSNGTSEIATSFSSGVGEAMSGLGALAGLAGALGVRQPGIEQVRIGRNTGQLEERSSDDYSLVVTMTGGQILTIEGSDGRVLQDFAAQVIELLNDYLND